MAGPAVRQAVTQYGWDSEKADAAQAQLVRDCAEYYGLRRTLRAAGVALPTPFVVAPRMGNRGSYRAGHEGHGHHGCCDDTYEQYEWRGACSSRTPSLGIAQFSSKSSEGLESHRSFGAAELRPHAYLTQKGHHRAPVSECRLDEVQRHEAREPEPLRADVVAQKKARQYETPRN